MTKSLLTLVVYFVITWQLIIRANHYRDEYRVFLNMLLIIFVKMLLLGGRNSRLYLSTFVCTPCMVQTRLLWVSIKKNNQAKLSSSQLD